MDKVAGPATALSNRQTEPTKAGMRVKAVEVWYFNLPLFSHRKAFCKLVSIMKVGGIVSGVGVLEKGLMVIV